MAIVEKAQVRVKTIKVDASINMRNLPSLYFHRLFMIKEFKTAQDRTFLKMEFDPENNWIDSIQAGTMAINVLIK
jgi:hypothetical protein